MSKNKMNLNVSYDEYLLSHLLRDEIPESNMLPYDILLEITQTTIEKFNKSKYNTEYYLDLWDNLSEFLKDEEFKFTIIEEIKSYI